MFGKKKGTNIAKDVEKWINAGKSVSSTKSDVIKGAVSGAVRAVGDIGAAFIEQGARKEVVRQQLAKDILVDRARLEQSRHNDIIRAFVDAKSPAGLVAAIVGAATAPTKYRSITANEVNTSIL